MEGGINPLAEPSIQLCNIFIAANLIYLAKNRRLVLNEVKPKGYRKIYLSI